jgi:arylsulfatase A-like enzyme
MDLAMSSIKLLISSLTTGILILLVMFLFISCGPPPGPPNLLLIAIDTLRADHLGCYGYGKIQTPNIDTLAEHGILVRNSVSHVPITLPAFSSIMTSTLPPTNGVHDNKGFFLDGSAVTLSEILLMEGYTTCAVVGAVVLDSMSGISQGFDYYDDDFEAGTPGHRGYGQTPGSFMGDMQRNAEIVTNRSLILADSIAADKPFFLFVHYFDPHAPYNPPPPYSRIDPSLEEDSYERQLQLYDGEIAYTDEQIGRLLKALDKRGLLENTLVVLTSDHGEGLSGHGEMTHGYFAYDQTLRVPLIYSMPGKLPEGDIYTGLAGHINILPTVLDVLGIDWRDKHDFQGKSLYPFDQSGKIEYSYLESATPFIVFGSSGIRGIRSVDWKYLDTPDRELYDLKEDPSEQSNLIEKFPHMADSLRNEMNKILSSAAVYRSGSDGCEMSVKKDPRGDAGRLEKLQALGYIGTPVDPETRYEKMFEVSLADPKDGITEFNHQLSLRAKISMAAMHLQSSRLDDCLDILGDVGDAGDKNWVVSYYRGLAYMGKGEGDKAKEELVKALDDAPPSPERVKIRDMLRHLEAKR